MRDKDKERNAQSFGKKLVEILGEKHQKLREAKFIGVIFLIVLSTMIFIIFNKK